MRMMTTPETPKKLKKVKQKNYSRSSSTSKSGRGSYCWGSTTNVGSLLFRSSLTCSMKMNKPNWIKNELSIICSENNSENPHFWLCKCHWQLLTVLSAAVLILLYTYSSTFAVHRGSLLLSLSLSLTHALSLTLFSAVLHTPKSSPLATLHPPPALTLLNFCTRTSHAHTHWQKSTCACAHAFFGPTLRSLSLSLSLSLPSSSFPIARHGVVGGAH